MAFVQRIEYPAPPFTHGILSHPIGAQPSADSAGIGGMGRAIAARLLFYIRREPPRLPAERTPYEHQRIFTNAEADSITRHPQI